MAVLIDGQPVNDGRWLHVRQRLLQNYVEHPQWSCRWFEALLATQDALAGSSSTDATNGTPVLPERAAAELVALQRYILEQHPVWVLGPRACRGIMDPTSYNPGPTMPADTLAAGMLLFVRPPAALTGIEGLIWSRHSTPDEPDGQYDLSVVAYLRPMPDTSLTPIGVWSTRDDAMHTEMIGDPVLEILELALRAIAGSDIPGVRAHSAQGQASLIVLE